jgi:integrating conjugative element protein (TIGR03755 family)
MKKLISFYLTAMCLLSQPAFAVGESLYYEIGGGRLSDTALNDWNEFTIDLDAYASGSYSCGDFDIGESIKAKVRELRNVPDEFEEYLKVAALDYIYGLIALSIQKAAPGAYEYLTNAYLRHKEFVQLKVASCRQIERLVQNNGIKEFKDLAKLIQWQKGAEAGESVQEAEAKADASQGVPWVDGEYYGGDNQDPIKLVEHSVAKGYEFLTGSTAANGDDTSSIRSAFPNSSDAVDWAVQVFGEKLITFTKPSQSITGSGLYPEISKSTDERLATLDKVLRKPTAATKAELDSLSTPGFRVTPEALSAINSQSPEGQNLIKNRLASEIATYQAIERAYFIRSLVVAALDEPNFYFTAVMPKHFDVFIGRIDDDIKVARNRAKIRQEFVGDLMIDTFKRKEEVENRLENLPDTFQPQEQTPDGAIIEQ